MEFIRLLFWLKWKLMWRRYQRNTTVLVGTIIAIVFIMPFAFGIAISSVFGYLMLTPPWNSHLLRLILLAIYLFWVLGPLLNYALNESYDITRLFLYPLSSRQIFLGAIFGSFLDFPVLLALPTLLAILVGFIHNLPGIPIIVLAVAFFLFQTIATYQALLLLAAGFLRSRRYRDVVIVLGPVLAILVYVSFQVLPRQLIQMDYHRIVASRAWDIINYLPPGLAARAIYAASTGAYLLACGFLLLLAVVSTGTVYISAVLLDKICTGVVVSASARSTMKSLPAQRNGAQPFAQVNRAHRFTQFTLPPVVKAVIDKEWKYYIRDPYFKAVALNFVYMMVVWIVIFLRPTRHSASLFQLSSGAIWGMTAFLLLMELQLAGNIFGIEGVSATTLFTFPSSRRQIFLGKNIILLFMLTIINAVLLLALCLAGKVMAFYLPILTWILLGSVVLIAAGNLISVWLPTRTIARGWRMQQRSAGQGCSQMLLTGPLYFGTSLLLVPVILAVLAPSYFIAPVWFFVTIPIACIYATGCYLLSLSISTKQISQREIQIAEKLAEQDD